MNYDELGIEASAVIFIRQNDNLISVYYKHIIIHKLVYL